MINHISYNLFHISYIINHIYTQCHTDKKLTKLCNENIFKVQSKGYHYINTNYLILIDMSSENTNISNVTKTIGIG